MDDLLNSTVLYLREKAGYLLEADKQNAEKFYTSHHTSALFMPGFREIESLVALLPQMLMDLEYQAHNHQSKRDVYSPIKSRPSKKLSNYWYANGQLIPKVWERSINKIDARPCGWLLTVLTRHLIPYMEKTFKQVVSYEEEIKSNKSGISTFAKIEDANLRQYFERIERTLLAAKKTAYIIQTLISDELFLSDLPPDPLPMSVSWHYAVELIKRWHKPEKYFQETVNESLSKTVDMASLPFLYQRYVGLRLVEALQSAQWQKITPDKLVMVACFMGGVIEFKKDHERLHLWCEPRLNKNHPSGFTSAHTNEKFEQTPDYLIVKAGLRGKLDGYVLDATLKFLKEDLSTKAQKYISLQHGQYVGIQQQKSIRIAGCNAINKPLCSWVVSPNVHRYDNQLLSADGVFGVIPVDPRHYVSNPLDLFIKEIV